jgi:transcriptional regulator with XRE-family HTH domain
VHLERSFTQNPAPTGGNLVQPAWQTVIELRSRRGWTQEKLAEKSILSVRTIQNLERRKAAHLGTIAKIAEALGVPPRECIASATPLQQRQNGETYEAGASLPPCP